LGVWWEKVVIAQHGVDGAKKNVVKGDGRE